MKVEVYRNLHKDCWSVRDCKTGKVVNHVQRIHIENADLVVQPAGRAKVLREQRKNVHAFIRGYITTAKKVRLHDNHTREIVYNPYKYDSFVYTETKTPIHKAADVYLTENGRAHVYA